MLILMLRTKVPVNESSTYGTFVPGNESSQVQKFQLPMDACVHASGELHEKHRDEWRWWELFITIGSLWSAFPV